MADHRDPVSTSGERFLSFGGGEKGRGVPAGGILSPTDLKGEGIRPLLWLIFKVAVDNFPPG